MNDQLRRLWDFCRGANGLWRELLPLAACIGVGVIVMPCLIFAVGRSPWVPTPTAACLRCGAIS